MEKQIIELLEKIILEKYNLEIKEIKLETPPKKEFGDYAFGGFLLSKELKKSPMVIVNELKEIIENYNNEGKTSFSTDFIDSLNCEGPYLNIKLNNYIFTKQFLDKFTSSQPSPLEEKELEQKSKTIFVDYIGTNVGKPLHIAHMCTPNQGQAIINVYNKLGYNVISDSHIGDWGIIFGKLIFAFKAFGNITDLEENAIEHLFYLYVTVTSEIEKEKSNFESMISELIMNYDYILKEEYNLLNWRSFLNKKFYEEKTENITDEKIKEIFIGFLSPLKEENIRAYEYILEKYQLYCYNIEEQIREEFKKLSKGNLESIKLWESFTKESIKAMNIQLNRLHIQPDFDIGESFYEGLGLPKIQNYPDLKYNMKDIVNELIDKKIATKNKDGSVGVNFPEETKMPSCILQKRDGTNIYLTSDLCAIKYRISNWNPEKILYFVDVRQQLHLKQAFKIANMAGWLKKENGERVELFHAFNGFISLKEGAMSTRHGRIIKLDELLDESQDRAKNIILEKRNDIKGEELDNLARIIGIGAIKYGYLKKSRETDVIFDWDEFMTFEGNSGPYIQYAYVRAIRILEKEENFNYSLLTQNSPCSTIVSLPPQVRGVEGEFTSIDEIELVKELLNYENVLNETVKFCMPHILAGYCFNITKKFNSFYNNVQVISEKDENIKNLRLLLVSKFAETLKEGFNLLGIEMPEKM